MRNASMDGVTELGYVRFGVSSLPKWHEYLTVVLGMEVRDDLGDGKLWGRMDFWHHRLCFEQNDCDDMLAMGLRVAGPEEFRAMQATLKAKLGIDSAPQRLLGVCSPKVAHPLVTAEPDLAALLPCGASAHEATPGQTRVLLQDPRVILAASASQDPAVQAVLEEARGAVLRVVVALGGQGA